MQQDFERDARRQSGVSPVVVARLPRYYRCLRELLGRDVLRVSSAELARLMKTTASQIRQDLNLFGGFGQQGYGYNVKNLYTSISDILGINDNYGAVIIGAGALGSVLASHSVFAKRGVILRGVFDDSPDLIGSMCAGFKVADLAQLELFCESAVIDIAVIAVTDDSGAKLARHAIDSGVKGIWNFSPTDLLCSSEVTVQNVYIDDTLMKLCYEMKQTDDKKI